MKCKDCGATYTHEYSFVKGKEQSTQAYKAMIYKLSIGATVKHISEVTGTPYKTAERFFKEAVSYIAPQTLTAAQEAAACSTKLILGIDDFAIRKGHNYNTGIHDLRGESLVGIAEGRTIAELRTYMAKNPGIARLKPYAVVMDLAKNYHAFATEFFPEAIRVADRFHVNRYILDALNEIRRRVSAGLPKQARLHLKRNKRLLNKRSDSLTKIEQKQLGQLLSYSTDLKKAHELKEMLIDWYDLSFNYASANVSYERWLSKGHALNIREINNALKTFINWKDEILNYHRCRFTNGIVEGRNAKIKSLQRRRFFLRNRIFYEALIIIECNNDFAASQFNLLYA
jgi:transposase